MTTWPLPNGVDGKTGPTPLGVLSETPIGQISKADLPSNMDLFLGTVGGSLGEVSAIALIIGGIFLVWKKIISPATPLAFIGTVFVIAFIYYSVAGGDVSALKWQYSMYALVA